MRTIYPEDGPRHLSRHPESSVNIHKPATPKWYSTKYLASLWAKRPAKILAVLGFIAVAAILIAVFAGGTESNVFGPAEFMAGMKAGVTVGTDGKIRLSVASTCAGTNLTPGQDIVSIINSAPSNSSFCFSPGLYRITGTLNPPPGASLMGSQGAIIDGAKVISGWVQSGSVWNLSGQSTSPIMAFSTISGAESHPEEAVGDDVYLNDIPLDRVGYQYQGVVVGQPISSVTSGTFFTNYDTGTITIGSSPVAQTTSIAVDQRMLKTSNSNVTLRGLTFQHDAITTIAMQGTGDVIDQNEVRYNHGTGIRTTGSTNSKVINNNVHHNGLLGISGDQDSGLVVDGNDVSYNDSVHFDNVGALCNSAGGSKWTNTTSLMVSSNNFHDNYCIGIWLDINNNGATVTGNKATNNNRNGLQIEISYHVMVSNNISTGNSNIGINVAESPDITVTGNTVSKNPNWEIHFTNANRTDHPSTYGPHEVHNFNAYGNDITLGATEKVGGDDTTTGQPALTSSWNNHYHDNTYHLSSQTQKTFHWLTIVDKLGWQGYGQDLSSTFF